MALSPITSIQSSIPVNLVVQLPAIETILRQNYPHISTPVGCNFALLQKGKTPLAQPLVLNAGSIPVDAPQHWGSVSKQFTAGCIAKLVKDGKLQWDDDIRKHLPNLPVFTLDGKPQKVAIDDLLHMRSGLPEVLTLSCLAGKNDETLSTQEKIDLLPKHPLLQFAPGTQMQYCNTNYYLLAGIVEAVAKENFVDYLRAEIFRPLGMQSRCSSDPEVIPTIDGYDENNQLNTTQNRTYGAVGIIGCPSDMAKWNASLDRRECDDLSELPRGIHEKAGENVYCRGLNRLVIGDYTIIYHMGAVSGFTTAFMRYENKDPNKNFAFFLTANRDDIPRIEKMVNEIGCTLSGQNLSIGGMPPKAKPMAVLKAGKFDDNYLCSEMGTHWVMETKPNALILRHGESHLRFVPYLDEKGAVYFEGPIGDRIEFTQDGFILTGAKVAPVHFLLQP